MKRRSIVLGTTVIALALAGPSTAGADSLGELGANLPQADLAARVQANVTAMAGLPSVPVKDSLGSAQGGADAGGSVKAKTADGTTGSKARVGLGAGGGARIGSAVEQRGHLKGELHEYARNGGLDRVSRGKAKLGADRHRGSAIAKPKHHAEHAVKSRSRSAAEQQWSVPGGSHSKGVVPLAGIGREVGNPIQLSLAAWLIALTGAGCLGASRVVRRLRRSRR